MHPQSFSMRTSAHANPSGASPGGAWAGLVQSLVSGFMATLANACKKPTAAMAQIPQKSHALTSIMGVPPVVVPPGLSAGRVCDAEYVWAKRTVRPSASQESAPRPLRAPRAVKAQGATSRNALQWQQIALHLADRVVNP